VLKQAHLQYICVSSIQLEETYIGGTDASKITFGIVRVNDRFVDVAYRVVPDDVEDFFAICNLVTLFDTTIFFRMVNQILWESGLTIQRKYQTIYQITAIEAIV